MTARHYLATVLFIGVVFTLYFLVTVVPPLMSDPEIMGAFAAGFVNPYSSGYAADAIACWFILAVWVIYEAGACKVRHGWICLLLGVVPGVAAGFAAYLLLRHAQTGKLLKDRGTQGRPA